MGNTIQKINEYKLTYLVAQKPWIKEPQIPRSDDFDLGIRNTKYKK